MPTKKKAKKRSVSRTHPTGVHHHGDTECAGTMCLTETTDRPRKTRYTQADVDSMLREQYESLKKEPNLHDQLEEAKNTLRMWDQEVEHRQRVFEQAKDEQAEAKRAVQLAAEALVAAAKEAQRNL